MAMVPRNQKSLDSFLDAVFIRKKMRLETSNQGLLLEQGRLLLASAEEDPDALKKWLASIEVAVFSWGVFFFSSWLG